MAYNQYSQWAPTGAHPAAVTRVTSNPHSTKDGYVGFPNKFDAFGNKENAGIGPFAVTESHPIADIVGGVLPLDHRVAVDITGGYTAPTLNGGGAVTSTDIYQSTITVGTTPSVDPFNVTYIARADQIHDTHINAIQNALMATQQQVGLGSLISGAGTGISTLNVVTNFDPSDAVEYSVFAAKLSNGLMLGHLSSDLQISSTHESFMAGYGNTGLKVTLGSTTANTRNDVTIDADVFTLETAAGADPVNKRGTYHIGGTTGDLTIITGETRIASQLTVGYPGGAHIDPIVTTVPPSPSGAFYSGAAIRAHGGIWFGSGMSGFGDITFITTEGENVDIEGDLETDTLAVNQSTVLNGSTYIPTSSTFTCGNWSHIQFYTVPYFAGNASSKAGYLRGRWGLGLEGHQMQDPDYVSMYGQIRGHTVGSVVDSCKPQITQGNTGQYGQKNIKRHPTLGVDMYPIIGGWTFTGKVNYNPGTVYDHNNVVLISSDMTACGPGGETGTAHDNVIHTLGGLAGGDSIWSPSLGGGVSGWGSYSSGLFSPGDTYIEFESTSSTNLREQHAYPIYYHEPNIGSNGTMYENMVTGLNLWVVGDDNTQLANLVGNHYRIFQPGNAPVEHLECDFSTAALPLVTLKFQGLGDSPNDYEKQRFGMVTDKPLNDKSHWHQDHIYKTIDSYAMTSNPMRAVITGALAKSVEAKVQLTSGVVYPSTFRMTGVAYIFACAKTLSQSQHADMLPTDQSFAAHNNQGGLVLKASPTPFGVADAGLYESATNSLTTSDLGVPLGEVVAYTTQDPDGGGAWTHVETTSYRVDGYYDSCWVPLVEYQSNFLLHDRDIANPAFIAGAFGNGGLGRCLPFYGTTTRQSDGVSTFKDGQQVYAEDSALGYSQFWVEHNLGPIRSLADLDFKAYVASYASMKTNGRNSVYPLLTGVHDNSLYKLSQNQYNLWASPPDIYADAADIPSSSTEHFAVSPLESAIDRGFMNEITHAVSVTYMDTRFALLSVHLERGDNHKLFYGGMGAGGSTDGNIEGQFAGYIRVIMSKSR
jgi:hypothetical protein